MNELITFKEIEKMLNIANDEKLKIIFYRAIIQNSNLISDNVKNISDVKLENTIELWKTITTCMIGDCCCNEDFENEDTYKKIVLDYKKFRNVQDLLRIHKIGLFALKSQLAMNLGMEYDEVKIPLQNSNSFNESNVPPKENKSFIYIAKQLNENNLYKIGCTDNISQRLGTFKVGNCFIEIVASKIVSDKYYAENWFHKYFKDKKYKGEWYKLNENDLKLLLDIFGFNFHINS